MDEEHVWEILERWAKRPDGWIHASEDPAVEREQFYQWGVWRADPHQDGEGGEG